LAEEVQRCSGFVSASSAFQSLPGDPIIGFQNAFFSYTGKAERAVMDRAHQAGTRLD
jgi:hypothetical protein